MKTVTTRTTMPAAAVALFATAAVLAVLPSEGRKIKEQNAHSFPHPIMLSIQRARSLPISFFLPSLIRRLLRQPPLVLVHRKVPP